MLPLPMASLMSVPMSSIALIAGGLGAFFLLMAFYKSLFHTRKTPDEAAAEAMEAQRQADAEDALKVKISDPFSATPVEPQKFDDPASPPVVTAPDDAQAARPKEKTLLAFRQLTPTGVVDDIQQKNSDEYIWE